MPPTIVMLLWLLAMGSFISLAVVLFFQQKTAKGVVYLVLGLATIVVFYYGIAQGWIAIPPKTT
ncbi:hypothetical protein [Paenibacillus cremeus]|uniref:DUF2759 domain-containing protein n=1 Tax=Paenibacillus cremeus TaxID=2163881 RepID=A0A559KEM0_9BACL|nr:hypothetical protein [Paenibacillus cremeus]TVY10568.1 hypothetical protein FPZ49_07480 [Paenibacillus cremeus]